MITYAIIIGVLCLTGIAVMLPPRDGFHRRDILFVVFVALAVIVAVALIVIGSEP